MIRAVLIDLGGTLVDYHRGPPSDEEKDRAGLAGMAALLARLGARVPPAELEERFYQPWIRRFPDRPGLDREIDPTPFMAEALPEGFPVGEHLEDLLLALHEPSAQGAVLQEGVREALQVLQGEGRSLVLVSNSPMPGACHDRSLELLGIRELLPSRLYSFDEGVRKPGLELFQRALDGCEAGPAEAVMIGDSWKTDLAPALRLGMRAVHFLAPGREPPPFILRPRGPFHATVRSWAEVPGWIRRWDAEAPA